MLSPFVLLSPHPHTCSNTFLSPSFCYSYTFSSVCFTFFLTTSTIHVFLLSVSRSKKVHKGYRFKSLVSLPVCLPTSPLTTSSSQTLPSLSACLATLTHSLGILQPFLSTCLFPYFISDHTFSFQFSCPFRSVKKFLCLYDSINSFDFFFSSLYFFYNTNSSVYLLPTCLFCILQPFHL